MALTNDQITQLFEAYHAVLAGERVSRLKAMINSRALAVFSKLDEAIMFEVYLPGLGAVEIHGIQKMNGRLRIHQKDVGQWIELTHEQEQALFDNFVHE